MAQAFFGGIHPNDQKGATNKKPVETLPVGKVAPPMPTMPASLMIPANCSGVRSSGSGAGDRAVPAHPRPPGAARGPPRRHRLRGVQRGHHRRHL